MGDTAAAIDECLQEQVIEQQQGHICKMKVKKYQIQI